MSASGSSTSATSRGWSSRAWRSHDFVARRDQAFWRDLRAAVPAWDDAIVEMNARAGVEARG